MLKRLNNSKSQLKYGVLLSYVNILVTITVSLIYTPYLLRMLGQSEYGLFSIAFAAIGAFHILDFGMGNATIRYTAQYRAAGNKFKEHALHGTFFIIYLILGLLVLILGTLIYLKTADIFSANMTEAEISRLKLMLIFVVPSVALSLPLSVFNYILTGYERFVMVKLLILVRITLLPIISIILLLTGYKAVALIAATSVINILAHLFSMYYSLSFLNVKFAFSEFNKKIFKEIINYSSFIALAAIAVKIDKNSNQFILSLIQGTNSVAIYAVGFVLAINFRSIAYGISSLLLPALAKIAKDGEQLRIYNSYFTRVGRIQFYVLGLFYVGFILFGKQFIILWAGLDYELSYYVCLLLISSFYIISIQEVGVTILQAKNKHQFNSILVLLLSIGNIILSSYLSNVFGTIGAAISLAGLWLIGHGIIMNIYYHKKANLNVIRFWVEILKILPAFILPVIFAIIYLHFYTADKWLNLALGVFVFLVLYAISAITITFNKYEKELLIEPIKKFINNHFG